MKKIRVHYIPSVRWGVFRKSIFGGTRSIEWVPDWYKAIREWGMAWKKH